MTAVDSVLVLVRVNSVAELLFLHGSTTRCGIVHSIAAIEESSIESVLANCPRTRDLFIPLITLSEASLIPSMYSIKVAEFMRTKYLTMSRELNPKSSLIALRTDPPLGLYAREWPG